MNKILKKTLATTGFVALCTATVQAQLLTQDLENNMDLMVVYNQDSRDRLGGNDDDAIAEIMGAVGLANLALRNSKTDTKFSLVWPHMINYVSNTRNSDSVLDDLTFGRAGTALADRDKIGADLVCLIADINDCGIAWVGADENYNSSVVDPGCMQHTLAHEVGHNYGLGHGTYKGEDFGGGKKPYAQGYVFEADGDLYKTIQIGNYVRDNVATIVYHYSNPNAWFKGARTGDAKTANSARRIRETRVTKSDASELRPFADAQLEWVITNKTTGRSIDVSGVKNQKGANIQQWFYSGGDNQKWKVQRAEGSWLHFRSAMPGGRALDVAAGSTENGANIQLWDYQRNNRNQHFTLDHSVDGFVRITSRVSDKVLQVGNGRKANGVNVNQWSWLTEPHMEWYLGSAN